MTLPIDFLKKTAILAMASFLFIGCEKPNDELGFNQVIDGVPGAGVVVYDSLIAYTHDLDSILVGLSSEGQEALGGFTGTRLIGSMTAGHFGRSQASLVSEMALSETDIRFGDNPLIDEAFLYLQFSGFYGDTIKPMSFEVYELEGRLLPNGVFLDAEGVVVDSAFYSDYEPVLGNKIGELNNIMPRPNSTTKVNGEVLDGGLKIAIDTNFMRSKFIDAPSSVYSSNQNFKDHFKGLYVKTTTIDGSVLYFNLSGDASGLYLYFHESGDTAYSKNVTFNFLQSNDPQPVNFNLFSQDYSGAYPVSFNLQGMNEITGEEVIYVQSMGGVYSVFSIPGLDTLSNKGYMINQAILEVYKAQGTGNGLTPHSRLEIRKFDKDTLGGTIKDFSSGSTLTGGGSFVSEPFRSGKYTFDITRYVFEIANGEESGMLAIAPYFKSSVANEVILSGGAGSQKPMSLKIYLTKP